jgi:hypothetical protein
MAISPVALERAELKEMTMLRKLSLAAVAAIALGAAALAPTSASAWVGHGWHGGWHGGWHRGWGWRRGYGWGGGWHRWGWGGGWGPRYGFAPVYHCWWGPWGRRCGV